MAASESSRTRRFSLPDLADERVDAAITAFLVGPARRRGRPGAGAAARPQGSPLTALENRLAWLEALRRESARNQRYRRHAAIIVIAAQPADATARSTGWLGRVAGPVAHAVRRGLRETDLVTRTADARFQVLLPETTGPEAAHVAERLTADCEVWLQAVDAPVVIRAAAAGTGPDITLEAALERALAAIDSV